MKENLNPRIPQGSTPQEPGGPTLTKQGLGGLETQEIAERYIRTGSLDSWNSREARYGDWSGVPEYREALDRVLEAQEAFEALPANVRDHVQNDPVKFLEMVFDPARQDELKSLGLVPRDAAPLPPSGSAGSDDSAPAADRKVAG